MNRKLTLGAIVAITCASGVASARDFDQYIDWQWTPHVINDTNANENVRNQMDFTVPIHGPWLTMPKPDSMSVTWITRIPCAGGIQYRELGTTNWCETIWPIRYGQIDYTHDIHNFNLTGLKPATTYEYRLVSNLDHYRTPYHMVICYGREIYTFRTVDPNRNRYQVWMTADNHGACRLGLDLSYEVAGGKKADYFFFLGDNLEDGPYYDPRFYITFGYLDDIVRVWGKGRPTIFMRGNHDVNGLGTYQYGDYFPQPDGKTYQAFRQGGVMFISLDTLWPARETVQNAQVTRYLIEQREWMRALKSTDDWKKAEFRVVMMHVAPFPGEGPGHKNYVNEVFTEFFCDETPAGKIHAVFSGHHHEYLRQNPNDPGFSHCNNQYGDFKKGVSKYMGRHPQPKRFPFVNLMFNLWAAVELDVEPGKLTFKSHRVGMPGGGFYDAFELTPDGKVRDLVETTALPMPEPPAPKTKKAK